MNAIVGGEDAAGVERAKGLLDRFLANRGDRTLQAYRIDIEDFGRFLGVSASRAVARLLANGPRAGRHLALDYAIDLRERGRAQATVNRRLATLRSLAGIAHELDLVDWPLEVPREEEISAAIQERAGQASYLLPRHPSEVDRLDLQHYGLRAALRANYLAPVESPERVLDVGSGTGQWGFDVCQRFPNASVTGIDLVAGKPGAPPRYRSVRANVLDGGVPFSDGMFDFVHQRLMVTGVPLASWPGLVADIVRVTRPGGWVELVEPMLIFERTGQATLRLCQLAMEIAKPLGLDTTSVVFGALDSYLRDAGLETVTRSQLTVPIGHWEGEVGALMATDARAAFTRLCEVLQARSVLQVAEGRGLIEQAQEEWEQHRTCWTFAIAFGRKP
ncbi:MAG TPA: methyltransferase domain-containing protein [Candidatus Dormibacteraeota bacterium]